MRAQVRAKRRPITGLEMCDPPANTLVELPQPFMLWDLKMYRICYNRIYYDNICQRIILDDTLREYCTEKYHQ